MREKNLGLEGLVVAKKLGLESLVFEGMVVATNLGIQRNLSPCLAVAM